MTDHILLKGIVVECYNPYPLPNAETVTLPNLCYLKYHNSFRTLSPLVRRVSNCWEILTVSQYVILLLKVTLYEHIRTIY